MSDEFDEKISAEKWRKIPGIDGDYSASSLGRLRNNKLDRIVTGHQNLKGYIRVTIRANGKQRQLAAHRLVLSAFFGQSNLHCNHKNGIKNDNRLENLEYVTQGQNNHHALANGLRSQPKGEHHWKAKLNDKSVRYIRRSKRGPRWLADKFKISLAVVGKIRTGTAWKHVK